MVSSTQLSQRKSRTIMDYDGWVGMQPLSCPSGSHWGAMLG